jgi:hypothetical protein
MYIPRAATYGTVLMWHFLNNRFPELRDAISRNRQETALKRCRMAAAINIVENVVDGTDSKIRLVPGYKKKLQNIIQSSLDFADGLVKQIPEAIEVSSNTFTSDPYVNAFFANVEDLQSVFSHSSEIQDYMEDNHAGDARCCALLCMDRSEKTIMGMELSGNMLKKDVLQVAVNFTDHRIYSPAPSEPEAREGLKVCLFQGLVTNALEHIVKLRLANHRLQSKRQMLYSRLMRYKQRSSEVPQGTRAGVKLAQGIEETSRELRKTEQEMISTPLMTPQLALEQVTEVFGKPDDFVHVRHHSLNLDKMGIRISDNAPQPGNKINLTEVTIGDGLPRVVTLATFPGKQRIPETVFSATG